MKNHCAMPTKNTREKKWLVSFQAENRAEEIAV